MPTDPRASYRVQLHGGFGFAQAAAIADYLDHLGISHLYTSPVLQAAPGSTHGYDVVDHSRVDAELGGEAGHAELGRILRARGMGRLLDIVPNHMAIVTPDNRWWWDVLDNGPSSRYASYFDVDWDSPSAARTVLLPVLEDQSGRVIEKGLITVHRLGGRFVVRYRDHEWPVAPRSLQGLLAAAAETSASDELSFLAECHGRLEFSGADDLPALRRRHRDKEVLKRMLERLVQEDARVAAAVDEEVARRNADPDAIDAILEAQHYRLSYWRTAARELGYRRFFDVNTLIGLRVEVDRVFFDTHALVLGWLEDGTVDGLRIDHPDGLRDPAGYLQRLRSASPSAWVVVEKVLVPGEALPADWPVAGTTGYDFLQRVSALLVDPEGEPSLTATYGDFTGERRDYPTVLREKKHQVLREVLGGDLNRLTELLLAVCRRHRRHRDHTRHDLEGALAELVACFPAYRAYVRPQGGGIGEQDAGHVKSAVARARLERPDIDPLLLDFLGRLLLLEEAGEAETELVLRFQQVTGAAMAKGGEDTAFYCYNRLVSLNEVGGDPGRFGLSLEAFHESGRNALWHWPQGLLATSTHDTKRGEDVRARIHLLAEVTGPWRSAVFRWREHNDRHWKGTPDRNLEYLLYQTLVGAWPLDLPRALAYALKAAREAKAHTSWTATNREYEVSLQAFVEGALGDEEFQADLASFVAPLVAHGRTVSLAQVLLKLTTPGVPDTYQGTELWDSSLVDPDNRRPVDFESRRRLLAELADLGLDAVTRRADEGLPKLWLISRTLDLRRRRPEPFGPRGEYEPLSAVGPRADHVVAFARKGEVIAVAPRFPARLDGRWEDTTLELPEGRWRDELTGEERPGGRVALARLLGRFPVSLLARS